MAGDFDSLMADMGVKRMEDDKHQAKATRKVKAKATTVRRKANASAAPQAAEPPLTGRLSSSAPSVT